MKVIIMIRRAPTTKNTETSAVQLILSDVNSKVKIMRDIITMTKNNASDNL